MRGLLSCLTVAVSLSIGALGYQQVPTPRDGRADRQPAHTLYEESHALLIGVSTYQAGWSVLPGVREDIDAVGAVLTTHGFSVESILDPTRERLDTALRTFIARKARRPNNRILIYFAGHGYTQRLADGREVGYIVPADAPLPELDPSGFALTAVSMEQMEVHARAIESKHALFVFDSCFSGALFRVRGEAPATIQERVSRPVREFLTAGAANQTVPDVSVFRRIFVDALQGRADVDQDGYVTGTELGLFVENRVTNLTNRAQTPQFGKIRDRDLSAGDVVFRVGEAAEASAAPPAPLALPDTGDRSSSCAEGAFLTADQRAVCSAIAAYESAFESLDERAVRRIWPTVNVRSIQVQFRSLVRADLVLRCGNVVIDGSTATASCEQRAFLTYRRGAADPAPPTFVIYSLQKRDTGWVIVGIE